MLKRRSVSYGLLGVFGISMIVLLMLDDPTMQHDPRADAFATVQSQYLVMLFPELEQNPERIYGLEVLDVADGTAVWLMRDLEYLWYAPGTEAGDAPLITTQELEQYLAQNAAFALTQMAFQNAFDATPENFEAFGWRPAPSYRIQFGAQDSAGKPYEPVVLEVGDTNPNNVAYYVWPKNDERIYLVPDYLMEPLLDILTESLRVTPETIPANGEAASPVP